MTTPTFDPVRGKAAFDSLLPRYKAMSADSLATLNADAALAAVAAIGVAARVNAPEWIARFKSLPATEFDSSLVEQLPTIAWACWYAATEDHKGRALATDAKLPADLVQKSVTTEARMQACCEYYFNDHPEIGPYLAMLRAGTGYQDIASDLLGYAGIYREHYDTISGDKKHFRATDADEAVHIAEEMLAILGGRLSPEARLAADYLARAWTLLLDTYNEVATTGRWLLRRDPQADKTFPSLFSMVRTRHSRGKNKPDPTPAPAGG
jgi:hypothetical protein